ncbi:hypothetical protein [Variovorax paradoxus]|uniref:hypothetical protein n=1 Tax=Variovorax paradoxus TaxID=34073 RepID=UPI0020A06F27|nr:hypothetical protein [Variovorax paradoxus]
MVVASSTDQTRGTSGAFSVSVAELVTQFDGAWLHCRIGGHENHDLRFVFLGRNSALSPSSLRDRTVATSLTSTRSVRVVVSSVEAYRAASGQHQQEIKDDIANYTDIQPVVQISEVVVERSGV